MLRLLDHLRNHGLHNSDVAVQSTSNETSQQGNPVALGQTKDQAGDRNATETDQNDGFPAITIRERAPTHGGDSFGDGVSGDQKTSVEGCVGFVAIVKVLDHGVCVSKNGVEGDGLREATYRWIWSVLAIARNDN